MSRLILWAMNPLFLMTAVILSIALQTALFSGFPLYFFQPNLILLATVWCALKRDFIEGGILVMLFGHVAETHSSAPQGTLMVTFMTIFLSLRLGAVFLNLPGIQKPFVMVFILALAFPALNSITLSLLNVSSKYFGKTLFSIFLGAVTTSLLSAWIFRGLDRFDWITFKHPKARQLLENDIYLSGEGL